jgi:hypothetical protein
VGSITTLALVMLFWLLLSKVFKWLPGQPGTMRVKVAD